MHDRVSIPLGWQGDGRGPQDVPPRSFSCPLLVGRVSRASLLGFSWWEDRSRGRREKPVY